MVEIAASGCGECKIGVEQRKWLNVGMSEKHAVELVCVRPAPNFSFAVNSLFKVLATVVHSNG